MKLIHNKKSDMLQRHICSMVYLKALFETTYIDILLYIFKIELGTSHLPKAKRESKHTQRRVIHCCPSTSFIYVSLSKHCFSCCTSSLMTIKMNSQSKWSYSSQNMKSVLVFRIHSCSIILRVITQIVTQFNDLPEISVKNPNKH